MTASLNPATNPEVSVAWGSYKIEAKGIYGLITTVVLILLLGAGAIQWNLYSSLKGEIKTVQSEIRILSYVLTQSEENRPKLLMPQELRERMAR